MKRIIIFLIYLVVIIGFSDQAMNIVGCYRTFSGLENGISKMALWFLERAKPGSIVITNFEHGLDVSYFANRKIENYFSINVPGFPFNDRILTNPSDFLAMLAENYGKRDIYFLVQTPGEHKYSDLLQNRLEPKTRFIIKTEYPFVDPLKNLTQKASFAGPPDLARNFSLTSGTFSVRCDASYELYMLH